MSSDLNDKIGNLSVPSKITLKTLTQIINMAVFWSGTSMVWFFFCKRTVIIHMTTRGCILKNDQLCCFSDEDSSLETHNQPQFFRKCTDKS